jgi:CheY-like chemotaxis protein
MSSVLLVDDTGLFAAAAEEIERRTQCRTLRAATGSEAIAVARRERPEIAFIDAEMSGMTGVDICRVLKADSHLSGMAVIVAAPDDAATSAAQRAGADACLVKPFDQSAIFDALRRFLQLSPRDAARAAVEWPVTFWRDGGQHEGTLRDLSRGGFFIRTLVRQPVGARLEVSFEIPLQRAARTIVAEAIVVRLGQEPDRGLGCRFFRITAGSRGNLEECLAVLEAGAAVGAGEPKKRHSR